MEKSCSQQPLPEKITAQARQKHCTCQLRYNTSRDTCDMFTALKFFQLKVMKIMKRQNLQKGVYAGS